METELVFKSAPSSDCGCCELPSNIGLEDYGCNDRKYVVTPREQAVLKRIREASEMARALKNDMRRYEGEPEDFEPKRKAMRELTELRRMRASLEEERVAAAEERMRLLGHA